MDPNIENALVNDLGKEGYELISRMLALMGSGNQKEVRSELRKMVEAAADAERVQADQD